MTGYLSVVIYLALIVGFAVVHPLARRLLGRVDLTVERGEYVAIMGASGSGKSTLMNLIGCLDTPTSGSYVLNGVAVQELDDTQLAAIRNKEIGFVFQTFNLLARTDALHNVELPLIYAGVSNRVRRERAEQMLEKVGLADRMRHRPTELSGGQRQRVAIARAIVRAPKVFLFDEPLSNLDAALRGQTRVEIAKLHRELGATTIYVTHDQVEAMTLADRVVVLRDGAIEQERAAQHTAAPALAPVRGRPLVAARHARG